MPSLNNFLLQALLEKGQLCLQNNSMDANNFVAMMNELALEVFLENVSKADLLNEAQMKHIKRYSTINKPELIKILWNSAVFIDKTNLKRIKTVNSKRTTTTIVPEPVPEPVPELITVTAPETAQLHPENKKRKCYIYHALRRFLWIVLLLLHVSINHYLSTLWYI